MQLSPGTRIGAYEVVSSLGAGGMEIDFTLVANANHYNTAFGFLAYYERATDESISWVKARLEE